MLHPNTMARPRPTDNLTVPLDEELRTRVVSWFSQMTREVVQSYADRDYELYQLRQQLEGVSQPGADNGPYTNSCQLQDPVSREFHTTVHADIVAAFEQKPYVTLEALRPQDDEVVQKIETLANSEAELFGFSEALRTVTYIALESRVAICGVFYKTVASKHKELLPTPPDASVIEGGIGEIEADIDQPGDLQLYQKNDVTESFEFRPIDPWDFWLSPPGVAKVQEADHTIERLWLTKTALIDGIANEGFDEEEVYRLIAGGPTATIDTDNVRQDRLANQGVNEVRPSFWECFRIVGRMPYLEGSDGRPTMPEQFLGEDFEVLLCPAHNIAVKVVYSPYPVRPYAAGKALGPDNEFTGHGVVSMISAINDEMTIMLRAAVDSVNQTMDPQMKVPEHLLGYYSVKDHRRPGSLLPYRGNDPNSIQPVSRDFAGLEVGMGLMHDLYNRCANLVAAQGVNTNMGGKVRKAAEVDFTAQVIQNKFGLMLNNLAKIVEEMFRIYLATRRYHLNDAISVRTGMTEDEVTKDDLDVPYRIIPHADPDNASSALRLQNDMALVAFVRQSPLYQQKVAMGDLSSEWMLATRVLSHMGIRNPESLIGPKPGPMDPMAIIQRIYPIVMQGAQAGDPVAMAIVQTVQAMAQEAMMAGGAMGGNSNSAVTPGVGMTLPAMPDGGGDTTAPMGGRGGAGGMNGGGGPLDYAPMMLPAWAGNGLAQ